MEGLLVLPAYVWPPRSWVEKACEMKTFQVGYPPRLPKGSYYARYWLPEGRWLSVPLLHSSKSAPFTATWPPDKRWQSYHWRTLLTLYGKAPFFYEWKPFLEYLYMEAPFFTLVDFTRAVLTELARLYGWRISWSLSPLQLVEDFPPREPSILSHLLRVGI